MNKYKINFLIKGVFGRTINSEDQFIEKCIKLAYKDMLSSGRYYLKNNYIDFVSSFKKIVINNKYVFSKKLIMETSNLLNEQDIISNNRGYVTTFGLAQKIVNMFFKYLYIIEEYLEFNINFSLCDCPLDSVILSELGYTKTVWSKLDIDTYDEIQNII